MSSSPPPSDSNTRIAVLVDDEYVERWKRNALALLASESDIEITHVIEKEQRLSHDQSGGSSSFVRHAIDQTRDYPLWSLVGVARLLTADQPHERPTSIKSVEGVPDATWLTCTPEPADSFGKIIPDATVDAVEGNVDVVIRFGFGMLKGRILHCSTHGVLSYHPGDIREYRGQPGGFWELLNDEHEMGVTLQRINETLDGGEIAAFEPVDISDANTWQEIKHRAFSRAETMLVPGVRTLVDEDKSPAKPAQLGDLYTHPRGWDVIRYLLKNTSGRVRNRVDEFAIPRSSDESTQFTTSLLVVYGLIAPVMLFAFTRGSVASHWLNRLVAVVALVLGLSTSLALYALER